MKQHIRSLACGTALLAAIALVACGGKQTMASKSAAAYDEAKKKGNTIDAGEHGGHSAETAEQSRSAPAGTTKHGAGEGMDHGAMPGMDHSKMPAMQHGSSAAAMHDMAAMNHSAMGGMDHSKMPGMQHGSSAPGTHDMARMDRSAMPGMAHGSMTGMQHGSQGAAPIVIAPPTSSSAIAQTQPAAALRPDELDAPSPTAVQEAAKAASGTSHEHHPPPPAPPPGHHHHDGGAS